VSVSYNGIKDPCALHPAALAPFASKLKRVKTSRECSLPRRCRSEGTMEEGFSWRDREANQCRMY
jgi:hypothetical protein